MTTQTITLRLTADTKGLVSEVKVVGAEVKKLGRDGADAGESVSRSFNRTTGVMSAHLKIIGAVGAAYAAIKSVDRLFEPINQSAVAATQASAQLDAVLKSTNNSIGIARAELDQLSQRLASKSTFGTEQIAAAQTRLLSYSGIVGEQFPRAMQAVIDQSTRLGISVEQSAETIGRALESPSKAAAALAQQGFGAAFTAEVRATIAALEELDRESDAQAMILDILEESYAGAAAAARNTYGGAVTALRTELAALNTTLDNTESFDRARAAAEGLMGAIRDDQALHQWRQGWDDALAGVQASVFDAAGTFIALANAQTEPLMGGEPWLDWASAWQASVDSVLLFFGRIPDFVKQMSVLIINDVAYLAEASKLNFQALGVLAKSVWVGVANDARAMVTGVVDDLVAMAERAASVLGSLGATDTAAKIREVAQSMTGFSEEMKQQGIDAKASVDAQRAAIVAAQAAAKSLHDDVAKQAVEQLVANEQARQAAIAKAAADREARKAAQAAATAGTDQAKALAAARREEAEAAAQAHIAAQKNAEAAKKTSADLKKVAEDEEKRLKNLGNTLLAELNPAAAALDKYRDALNALQLVGASERDMAAFADAFAEQVVGIDAATQAARQYETQMDVLRTLFTDGVISRERFDELAEGAKTALAAAKDGTKALSDQAKTITEPFQDLRDVMADMGTAWSRSASQMVQGLENVAKGSQTATRGYAQMTAGASGFFKEGSKGYQAMQIASQAFYAMEIASNTAAMVAKVANAATQATAEGTTQTVGAGKGLPFPANLAAMAATAAVLAGMGVFVKGGSGGGSISGTAANIGAGTGTVVGDPAAQSKSIERALDTLAKIQTQGVNIAQQQLMALRQLASGISNTASALSRNAMLTGSATGQQVGGLGFEQRFTNANLGAFSVGGVAGVVQSHLGKLFGDGAGIINSVLGTVGGFVDNIANAVLNGFGGTKREVIDNGLLLQAGQNLASVITDGIVASFFTTLQTKEKDWTGHVKRTTLTDLTAPLDAAIAQSFDQIAQGLGDAALSAAQGLGLARDYALDVLKAVDLSAIGFDKISFDNLTGKELEEKLSAVFSTLGDVMAEKLIPGIAEFVRNGEGAFEALVRVSAQTQFMADAFDVLGMNLRTSTGGISLWWREVDGVMTHGMEVMTRSLSTLETAHVVQSLADLSGGFDALSENVSGFLDLTMSEAEKTGRLGQRLADAFGELGQPLPATTDALRALVSGLDVTTDQGQRAFVTITELTPALSAYYDALKKGEEDRADFTRGLTERIEELTLSAEDLASVRLERTIAGWYEEAERLGMDTSLVDQLAELERAALKTGDAAQEAARDFGSLISSLQGQILSAQRGLQTYGMSGSALTAANAGFAFADNMAAAAGSPEAQKLAQDLYALNMQMAANQQATEAAAAAQQAAAARAQAYEQALRAAEQAKEQAIRDAQQNLDQARRDVIDAYNREADALKAIISAVDEAAQRVRDAEAAVREAYEREAAALREVISAADAAASAVDSARQDVVRAIDAQISSLQAFATAAEEAARRVADAQGALKQAYDAESAPLRQTIDRLGQLGQTLRDFARSIGTAATSTAQTQQRFDTLAARARAGDADAMAALPQAGQAALDAARGSMATRADFDRYTAQVQRQALEAAAAADAQVSDAQRQLDALTAQVTALGVLNESVLSVKDAIADLLQAKDAEAIAKADSIKAQTQIDRLNDTRDAVKGVEDSTSAVDDAIRALSTAEADGQRAKDAAREAEKQLIELENTARATGALETAQKTLQEAIDSLTREREAEQWAKDAAKVAEDQLDEITNTVTNLGFLGDAQKTLAEAIGALGSAQAAMAAAANRPVVVNVAVNAPAQQQAAPQVDYAKIAQLQSQGTAMQQLANNPPMLRAPNGGPDIGTMQALAASYAANAEAIRQQIRSLGGIPAFASGGAFTNGIVSRPTTFNMGLMGESGSEGILPLANVGGKLGVHAIAANDGAMVDELKALRAEVANLRREQAASQYAIAANTGRLDRRQDKWDRDGLPTEREAVA